MITNLLRFYLSMASICYGALTKILICFCLASICKLIEENIVLISRIPSLHVLSDTRDVLPAAFQYWNQQGIAPQFLANFWVILWARKQPHQILHVQWLLVRGIVSQQTCTPSLAGWHMVA